MSKRKKRNNGAKRVLISIIALVVIILGCIGARSMYIKSREAKAAQKEQERLDGKKVENRSEEWVKEDGKSYYYDKDGKVVVGRFVDKKKKKIYYTDSEGAVTRTVDGNKPMVAVTYDDGPSQFTTKFVELFQKNDSAATFFEVGNRIDEFDGAAEAVAESYCELANHTYTHQNLTRVSVSDMKKQINNCNSKIRKAGETADEILFRAPEGAVNDTMKSNLNAAIILWSVDTLDWKSRNAQSVHKIATTNIKDGDIILMHSLYESTYEASKKIVPDLLGEGFQLVTVTDLAEFRGGLNHGEKYFSLDPVQEEKTEATTSQEK